MLGSCRRRGGWSLGCCCGCQEQGSLPKSASICSGINKPWSVPCFTFCHENPQFLAPCHGVLTAIRVIILNISKMKTHTGRYRRVALITNMWGMISRRCKEKKIDMRPRIFSSFYGLLMLAALLGLLLLAVLLGRIPGSASASSWMEGVRDEILNRAGVEYITGWVDCGVPVVDAEIRVYDADGKLLNLAPRLQSAPVLTGASGVFSVAVANLPDRFRVKALNGHCGDDAFSEMEAEFKNVDLKEDILHVNMVTTVLARYLDHYPSMDYDEAQATVKHFLQIPDSIDLSNGPDIPRIEFNLERLLAEAVIVEGGIDPLIERILAEMVTDPFSTFQFQVAQSSEGDGISWVAEKILGGIVSGTSSRGFGYFLSAIGFPGADENKILEEIKKIQETLSDIKDGLVDLDSKLQSVGAELSREISVSEYNNGVRTLVATGILSDIKNASKELATLAALRVSEASRNSPDIVAKQERLIQMIEERILPHLSLIPDFQYGVGFGEGLIQVWSKIVSKRKRFLYPIDGDAMRAQFDYFDALQLAALALVVEYYHAVKPAETVHVWVDPVVTEYEENRKAQLTKLPSGMGKIPEGAIVETHSGLMIAPELLWKVVTSTYGSASFGTANFYVIALNKQNYLGFNNWRLPTSANIASMFYGRPANNLGSWAIAEGYPRQYIDDAVVMFFDDGRKPGIFRLSNATQGYFSCYDMLRGWRTDACYRGYIPKWGTYGRLIPVRTPSSKEFYYYP